MAMIYVGECFAYVLFYGSYGVSMTFLGRHFCELVHGKTCFWKPNIAVCVKRMKNAHHF